VYWELNLFLEVDAINPTVISSQRFGLSDVFLLTAKDINTESFVKAMDTMTIAPTSLAASP
jgi:hypothetical protein